MVGDGVIDDLMLMLVMFIDVLFVEFIKCCCGLMLFE